MKNQFRPKNNKIKAKKSLRNKLKSLLQVKKRKKMMNKDQEMTLMIKDQKKVPKLIQNLKNKLQLKKITMVINQQKKDMEDPLLNYLLEV